MKPVSFSFVEPSACTKQKQYKRVGSNITLYFYKIYVLRTNAPDTE